MSKATFTFGRFNPPTEIGHGKLVGAVQAHAEKGGEKHYVFPSHSQDKENNPLSHTEKVSALRRLFPDANIVSEKKVRTAIDAMKHLEKQGHTHVTMVVGSDRVREFHGLLNKYRKKEFPGIKKVDVKSAGNRDPDAAGAEGMSASKLRGLVKSGKREEFISHYSDKELGAKLHDKVQKAMNENTAAPIGIFLLGGPGSGKDYVLNNIFSRFDLVEVQIDQVLNGAASELFERNQNVVINGAADLEKIQVVQSLLEGYAFDYVYVSVTNKVSRQRNEEREMPLLEQKRLEKWYRAEKLAEELDCFVFNNSINLNESSDMEKVFFGAQIEKLLARVVDHGLEIQEESKPVAFTLLREKKFPAVAKDKESGLPKKYVAGLSSATAKARKTHWKKAGKLSDSDPRAYEPAPGDATAKTKPSKHTLAVRKMMDEAETLPKKLRHIARSGNVTAVKERQKENKIEEASADNSLSAKAAKSGISVGTLRKVYNRGVAAWNSGHRPGTTPQQWGHARVNSYINKGKTYHTADKDLREEIDQMFESEFENCCPDMEEAVDLTPTISTKKPKKGKMTPGDLRSSTLDGLPTVSMIKVEEKKPLKSFMKTPQQIPAPPGGHSVPPGYERVKSWGGAYELRKIKEKPTTVKEAVEYHIENQISFTENVFRPGSEMFFEMISEAKKLYNEGNYTPADEFELDMLNSDIGEIAEYEGQLVVLDYPIEEGLEEACWSGYTQKGLKKKGNRMVPNCVPVNETEEINEILDAVYPHKYHGTLDDDVLPDHYGPEHHYTFQVPEKENPELRHTYSVSISREGKTGHLAFGYHGKQPENYTPITGDDVDYLKMAKPGIHKITGEGGGKASSILSTVAAIAKKHAKKHGLTKIKFAGDSSEPSRTGLYARIANRFGGKQLKRGGTASSHVYSVPIKEADDPTDGKGIGKPWREGGGGAVYVRTGDGGVKKVRFSQSGMTKKFNDPAATRSFVARHHCMSNKDKTSASYWACRYPRFFSNSGKLWW